MADGITGTIKPAERNALGGYMADALRSTQDWLNKATISGYIPYTDIGGSIPVGEMLMGEAPRLADDMSYGDYGIKRTGHGYNLDPAYADLAGVGAVPAAATKKTGQYMVKALREEMADNLRRAKLADMFAGPANKRVGTPENRRAMDLLNPSRNVDRRVQPPLAPEPDQSKRTFLKGMGALTAAAASPTLAIKALKEGATEGAVAGAKAVAPVAAKGLGASALREGATAIIAKNLRRSGSTGPKIKSFSDEELAGAMPDVTKRIEDKLGEMSKKYGDDFDMDHYIDRQFGDPEEWDQFRGSPNTFDEFYATLEGPDSAKMLDAFEAFEATGKWPKGSEKYKRLYDAETLNELRYFTPDRARSLTEGSELFSEMEELLKQGGGGPQ